MGTLYLVATPIGNLEDITERATRVLREVDLIAAEDTRHAAPMLKHYGITTRLISFHGDSPASRLNEIIEHATTGDVAVISDAGMPGISDPGGELVQLAWQRGIPIIPIPGASAVPLAAAVSGDADRGFIFAGFLPRKSGELRERLQALAQADLPIVVFESPNRVRRLLETIAGVLPDATITYGREITKLHEEWQRGPAADLLNTLTERGEFTLVISAPSPPDPAAERLDDVLQLALDSGMSVRDAAALASVALDVSKSQAYQRAIELRDR